ncbi:uncharacterized protein [Haliotis asinina]|uniref:uncharacterized protein n=1 Tax=Haliotis asinina TaxID=109174 RepID=UPI003531B3D0
MGAIGLVTGLLLLLLEDVRTELCYNNFMNCENGCCGSTCCENNIPVIVGSTVGGVVFIVILIISVCVYVKKGNKADRTIGVDPNMLATTALAAQMAGYSTEMVQPFGYSAVPHPPLHSRMQPLLNPLLSYPLSANLPPPYFLPATQPPPNSASAAPAAANQPPPNPAPATPAPANPAAAPASTPNPSPASAAPSNPPPQQAPSPN